MPDHSQGLLLVLEELEKRGASASAVPDPTEGMETIPRDSEFSSLHTDVTPPHVSRKNMFQHPDTHPIILDMELLNKFGPDWLNWEIETVELRVPEELGVPSISDLNLSKIQSCKALHLIDTPWEQYHLFVWCIMPFNGVLPDFDIMQVPSAAQCLIGVDIMNRIRDDTPWSEELKVFLGTVYRHDDIFMPIEPTDFALMDLHGVPVNLEEIGKRWPQVRRENKAPTGQTAVDEQLRRMLDLHRYLETSRLHLRQQLPLVQHA